MWTSVFKDFLLSLLTSFWIHFPPYNGDLLSSQRRELQQLQRSAFERSVESLLCNPLQCSELKQFGFSNVIASLGNPLATVNTTVLHFKLSSAVWKVLTASFEVFSFLVGKRHVFLNHNSAGFHRTSSLIYFRSLFLD